MATDATFDNQLQALATATANFANGKDAAIKNTIITALGGSTQSGGSTGELTWTVKPSAMTRPLVNYDYYHTIEGGIRLEFFTEGAAVNNWFIDVTAQ